jgi:S1-C subfamily serine protease
MLAVCVCIMPTRGQAETVVDSHGTSAPCISIVVSISDACVQLFENSGLIRGSNLGTSGIALATTGEADGTISAVAAGSPAEAAGLKIGDKIVSVNGKPTAHTKAEVAQMLIFGRRGDKVHLKVQRDGKPLDFDVKRDAETPPPSPASTSKIIYVRPIINWKGEFIPCAGAGIVGPAAISYCDSHFKDDGYIKASELGTTGLTFDPARKDGAWVSAVAAGSAAEKAGIKPGDQLVEVNGNPMKESLGDADKVALFGKAGDVVSVSVMRGASSVEASLTLAKAK